MRVAAIDIGSYSVRLTIAEVLDGEIRILHEAGRITSLGSGVGERGVLEEGRMEETLRVLESYRREIERFGARCVAVVATEALRRAKNSGEFLKRIKERTGFDVRILSPQEEGKLAFLATAYSLKPEGFFLVIDQGGGSTEFVFGSDLSPREVISLPVGIVNLTERFLKHDPPAPAELGRLRDFVRDRVAPLRREVHEMIGLGGTITTVAALEYNVYPYDPGRIHGRELTLRSLEILKSSRYLTGTG